MSQKPKLLLADDSVTIQRVIELTFADEDVQVLTVGDGQRAIERLEADRPDIVLADVGMPDRNGYEVAAYIRNSPHLQHVPVLLLAGAFEPVDEARARAVGCDGVLIKPFEPQTVITRVRELLAGERPEALWPSLPAAASAPRSPDLDFEIGSGASAPAAPARPPAPETQRPPDAAGPEAQEPGPATAAAAGDSDLQSLDDYFDRLDAAFAGLDAKPGAGAEGARAPAEPVDRAGAAGVPAEPEPAPDVSQPARMIAPPPPVRHPAPSPIPHPAPAAASEPPGSAGTPADPGVSAGTPAGPPAPRPSVRFSPADPSAGPARGAGSPPLAEAFAALLAAEQGEVPAAAPASPGVTDRIVEEVTRRVLERLSDRVVREVVSDVTLRVAERLVREEIERIKRHAG